MPVEITTTDGKKYLVEDHADNVATMAHVRNSPRNQWIRVASAEEIWVNRDQIVSMCVVEPGIDVE